MNTEEQTIKAGQSNSSIILSKRIDEVIKLIPENFPSKLSLVLRLNDRKKSLAFTHPDAVALRYQEVAEILNDFIGESKESWVDQISKIMCEEES